MAYIQPRVANRFATSRVNGRSLTLSASPGVVALLRLCRCDCGLVLGGLASAVARVTRVGWVAGVDVARVDVAGVDVVASGSCVVLASRRAWSLVIGGLSGSVGVCEAGFVFFDRVCFCLSVSERSACRAGAGLLID